MFCLACVEVLCHILADTNYFLKRINKDFVYCIPLLFNPFFFNCARFIYRHLYCPDSTIATLYLFISQCGRGETLTSDISLSNKY